MITFSPDGSIAYYEACRERVNDFPTDPNGGMFVPLWDDDFVEVPLANDVNVLFYGQWYDRFYIGSNGYITFGSGDAEYGATLENHFNMPRISGLFTDLNPPDDECISCKQFDDRIVVTFENVPLYGDKTATNSFQIEIFFVDGTICITWLDITDTACIAGLSRGRGLPPVFFEESDLDSYPPCWPLCDFDRNYFINSIDYSILAKYWMNTNCGIPYWCGKSDVDFSGTIDSNDLGILAGDWLLESDYWWLQPLSHWRFDEGSGTTAYDSAGNNNGTLYGDPCWVAGKIGDYALSFDGVNDYVDVPDDESLNFGSTTDFTALAWIKTSNPNRGDIVCTEALKAKWWGIYIYNNRLSSHIDDDLNPVSSTDDGAAINDGQWHHIAVTFDRDGFMKRYVDGASYGTADDISSVGNISNDGSLYIGCRRTSKDLFNGTIDDARIYDRTLSADEIQQLYQESL